jgi:integrase/recombinase XerC
MKYLPLEGLKRLLAAPQGEGLLARRNRAMLALMGVHGLWVAEVTGPNLDDVDLSAGHVGVLGKGRKIRTVYLINHRAGLLAAWLQVGQAVASDGVSALFVVVGPNATGTALGTRGIRYLVDRHLTDLGLKAEGISCHALRHSSAT